MKKSEILKGVFKEALKEVIAEDKQFRRELRKVLAESLKKNMKTVIREAVLADGTLSDIIAESVSGVAKSESPRKNLTESTGGNKSAGNQKIEKKPGKDKMGEMFKDMFDADVTEGTEPAPEPQNVSAGGGAPAGGGGTPSRPSADPIRQAEQQVKQMKTKGAGAAPQAAMKQQMKQQQAAQQAPQGNQQVKESDPTYSVDDDFKEKLMSGDRSHLQEKQRKFASKQQNDGD